MYCPVMYDHVCVCVPRFLHMEEGLAKRRHITQIDEDAEATLNEFRRPRDSLLCVVAEYFSHAKNRVRELRNILGDGAGRAPELLDHKSHNVSCSFLLHTCDQKKRCKLSAMKPIQWSLSQSTTLNRDHLP